MLFLYEVEVGIRQQLVQQSNSDMAGTITMAQLDAIAEEYMFNADGARRWLKEHGPKSRGRPKNSASAPGTTIPPVVFPRDIFGGKPAKAAKPAPDRKRGPTGYNMFVSQIGPRIREKLQRDATERGETLPPRAGITKVVEAWRALPEDIRARWNHMAASA